MKTYFKYYGTKEEILLIADELEQLGRIDQTKLIRRAVTYYRIRKYFMVHTGKDRLFHFVHPSNYIITQGETSYTHPDLPPGYLVKYLPLSRYMRDLHDYLATQTFAT